MSSQDVRCSIILDNLPKLIESLTGLKPSNSRFAATEHSALQRLRSHKFLSVNSHEVQRRLDNLGQRFAYANYEPYAIRLTQLCEKLRSNPLCTDHYETDVYWSVVHFLLEVARNPVDGLARNRHRIALHDPPEVEAEAGGSEAQRQRALLADLLADNFEPAVGEAGEAEELSDWSDSDSESSHTSGDKSPAPTLPKPNQDPIVEPPIKCSLPGIRPPAAPEHFRSFDGSQSSHWLSTNIQYSWWLDDSRQTTPTSQHPQSQFCHAWQRLHGPPQPQDPPLSTITEYCALREILWLFSEPVTCKLFSVDGATATVRPSEALVSLNSTSVPALREALRYFAGYATISMRLHTFCDYVMGSIDKSAPHTYECYAQAVRELLRPFAEWVLRTERQLAGQKPPVGGGAAADAEAGPQTLVRLQRAMEPFARLLDALYTIHSEVTLDFVRQPAHICSAYLLAALLRAHETSAAAERANLAGTLLMAAMRVYMQVIDTWWTDGRLEDWQQEFVIRNVDHSRPANPIDPGQSPERLEDFEMRPLSPNADRAFYVSRAVADTIDACPLIKMLSSHSIQASYTLNVLHALDRIGEMKTQCGYQENLFETFWNTTMASLSKLKPELPEMPAKAIETSKPTPPNDPRLQQISQFRQQLQNGRTSALLALVFEPSLRQMEARSSVSDVEPATTSATTPPSHRQDAHTLYAHLQSFGTSSACLLPLGDTIRATLLRLLTARIAVANRCVIQMYRTEFQALTHLHNLRRVFLLEASDIMFQFYTGLFRQMEAGDSWCNAYLLTDQLNGLLSSRHPDMCALFAVQVSSRRYVERNVLDALRNVTLSYAVPSPLRDIIGEAALRRYNDVFRLLLRIKWGMWTLEQLRFPLEQRRRRPYVRLTWHDRTFKRLALVRIWLLYSMHCVHSHVMTHVVQVLGEQLERRVAEVQTLAELAAVHGAYVRTVHEHCFLRRADRGVLLGVEQLLTLVCVVRNEWRNMADEAAAVEAARDSQIDDIESSYINCHAYITGVLNTQLYSKKREHLASLAAAFSCSCPY